MLIMFYLKKEYNEQNLQSNFDKNVLCVNMY